MEVAERKLFQKSERLHFKKDIDQLFENGQSFISYPLRIVYLSETGTEIPLSGISILIGVPKKRIRHAVNRNRIKRMIRETFRLNKSELATCCQLNGKHLQIAFMYVCNEVKSYTDLEKAMLKALTVIRQKEKL